MPNPTPSPSDSPKNTVRMSAPELSRYLQEMDGSGPASHHERAHVRWPFRQDMVRIDFQQPGGTATSLRYACRNLSAGGMGVLHSSFVYPGTKAVVYLPQMNGSGACPVKALVTRCNHYKGTVHEIGLRFTDRVNLRDFVLVDLMAGGFTLEHVAPEKLEGCLLHVDDSPMDRRLVRHFLGDTNLNVISTEDGPSALARAGENFDIILLDHDMPGMDGCTTSEKFRDAGVQCPIILVTADTREAVRDAAIASRVNALIAKPLSKQSLLRGLGEFLLLESSDGSTGGAIFSSLQESDQSDFVEEFVTELRQYAGNLQKALDGDDFQTALRMCSQIKSAAPSLGFVSIGDAASKAMTALEASMSVSESKNPIRNVMSMCLRARAKKDTSQAA